VSRTSENDGGGDGRSGPLALRAWCDFTRLRPRADDSRTNAARCFAGAALAVLLAAGCASPIPATEVATQAHPDTATEFTLVALPDTQYYAAAHPEIFDAQTRWIAAHEADHHIAAVVHEGDIVDTDEPWQWGRAWASLHQLDDVVPYLLSTGNHDYARTSSNTIGRATRIGDYFPELAVARGSRAEGMFERGHVENSFQIIDAPGGAWLILTLEFGPRDAVLTWADSVLRQHPATPAIVVTHAYLRSDDRRYDHDTPELDWNPHRYVDTSAAGGVNDGQEIWRKLIARNSNVRFVLCGHDLGDGVGRLTSVRADGTRVHQILANYQMGALGGAGYLRLMRFIPARRHVEVRTYSPYYDRFKSDAANSFELEY
jgi:hypothetical protein